jgi:hypothetical protein
MIFEAKQFAESDRNLREAAELRNRIQGQVSAIVRSFGEFGWVLDPMEQTLIQDSVQKARALPEKEDNIQLLRELLADLEARAAKLAAAMFNLPSDANVRPPGDPEQEVSEMDVKRLMQAALNDAKDKKT